VIYPLILSGGSGSRLWPLSRALYPKQFHALFGEDSLLQQTARRVHGVEGIAAPLVVCNDEHRFIVAEQLRAAGVQPAGIILEPQGRNTAPAAAIGALAALALDPAALVLVLPADHRIEGVSTLHAALRAGAQVAGAGHLVSFGIVPAGPETGYGYIQRGAAVEDVTLPAEGPQHAWHIAQFVEKPPLAQAERFVESGEHYWNSGMYLFGAATWLEELERHAPQMARVCAQAWDARQVDLDFVRLDEQAFRSCPADSIDYAVMEKSTRGAVIPVDLDWNDVGSWSALWDVAERDANGNVTVGDVVELNSRDSYLHSGGRLLAAVGVEGLVVVETDDAVLVATRDRAQDVKALVDELKRRRREEGEVHRRVYRPWGAFQGVDRGERFQVKRLIINPGARLSLQLHRKRAEHWVVVRGRARVRRGEETFDLGEDESTYIPLGTRHQLENVGTEPLELIEVQTGGYLGEDDIERFEDVYGRA